MNRKKPVRDEIAPDFGHPGLPDRRHKPCEHAVPIAARRRGVARDFQDFSDTFLTLAAIAPLLDGPTRLTGIAHTRRQETDRVAGAARELRRLGQDVAEEDDAERRITDVIAVAVRHQNVIRLNFVGRGRGGRRPDQGHGRHVLAGRSGPVQVIVDGRNSNTAAILLGYVTRDVVVLHVDAAR